MSDETKNGAAAGPQPEQLASEPQIVIKYNVETGEFKLWTNVQDEIITTGMLKMAEDKLRTNYRMAEMKQMRSKVENGIVAADGNPLLNVH